MYCDYHVHTIYSDDSKYLMEDVVKDAISKGIKEICFTDHVDYGIKVDYEEKEKATAPHLLNVNYPVYFNEIKTLEDKYKDKITLKSGLEFGIQTHTITDFDKIFHQYPMDFVILSCHQVEDKEFWTQDFQKGRSQKEYQERYYLEILNVIKVYKNYSVLGHLDLINRYDKNGIYPFENIKDIITQILKIVIEDGKGIEINTSSHRYGLSDLTPSRDILKLYKQLGGTIITIGSDSHTKDHLGAYIEETKEELKQLGFEYYCTFENMKPSYHKL